MKTERQLESKNTGNEQLPLKPIQEFTGEPLLHNLAEATELSAEELEGAQILVWRWSDYVSRTENLSGGAEKMVGVHLGNIYDEQDRMRSSESVGVASENERISEKIREMVGGSEEVNWKPLAAELFRKFKKNEHGKHHRNWREMDVWVIRLANGRDFVAMTGLIKPDIREEEWVMSIMEIDYQYKRGRKKKLVKVGAIEIYTGFVNERVGSLGMTAADTSIVMATLLDQFNLSQPIQSGGWGQNS